MQQNKNDLPIAVIDSGVGGITVLAELLRELPQEQFIFFADCANAPYGTKTAAEVRRLLQATVQDLVQEGIKALVIACNTATAAAAEALRTQYDFPIIGIEPAIKMATTLGGHPSVLVMATPLTLKQEKFLNLKQQLDSQEDITPLPCPGLMELIEQGHTDDAVLDEYLKELFAPLSDRHFDAVVLGCTHYPHAAAAIRRALGGGVAVFDGCAGTARQTRRRLDEEGLLRDGGQGSVVFCNSAQNDAVNQQAKALLEALS